VGEEHQDAHGEARDAAVVIEKKHRIQKFKDDPSLNDAEIATIASWVDAGAPRADPADMTRRAYVDAAGWTIGTPDSHRVFAREEIERWPPTGLGALDPGQRADRGRLYQGGRDQGGPASVTAPGKTVDEKGADGRALNIFVVHHAVVAGAGDGQAGGPLRDGARGRPMRSTLRTNWARTPPSFPITSGEVAAGSGAHLRPPALPFVGTEVVARVDVRSRSTRKGYQPKYRQSVVSMPLEFASSSTSRRPEQRDARRLLPVVEAGILMTFERTSNSSGKRMCMEALYPNGKREMLNCAGYNQTGSRSTSTVTRSPHCCSGHGPAFPGVVTTTRRQSAGGRSQETGKDGATARSTTCSITCADGSAHGRTVQGRSGRARRKATEVEDVDRCAAMTIHRRRRHAARSRRGTAAAVDVGADRQRGPLGAACVPSPLDHAPEHHVFDRSDRGALIRRVEPGLTERSISCSVI